MKSCSKGKAASLAAAGLLSVSLLASPFAAFAENGVQPGDSSTGQIDVSYDTAGGSWTDPDGVTHANGTYIVKVPTAITYTGMKAGKVATSDNVNITVAGVLPSGKSLSLAAETGKSLSNPSQIAGDPSAIAEVTSIVSGGSAAPGSYAAGPRSFTAAEVYGAEAGGSPSGTTVVDNVALSGTVLTSGTWSANVSYTASLV